MAQNKVIAPVLVFALVVMCWNRPSQAQAFHAERDCAQAQQIIADTWLLAAVVVHSDYEAFVESKPGTDPFVIHQFLSNPTGEMGVQKTLSCKMKTAERINNDFAVAGGPEPAQGDLSCAAIHQQWLARLTEPLEQIVVDEEELTFIGPMWTKPWPYDPVYRGDDGKLHVRSRALYVPFSWWVPMPDRFKGVYYCHLATPAYLEALSHGQLTIEQR